MEENLQKLYKECINELNSIGINLLDENIGKIDIKIAKRNAKRYGCCKQENPDKNTAFKIGRRVDYGKFYIHHIEISKWLMQLNNEIIKNTIIHELIHCLPYCNNHGKEFKKYSKIINEKLGYNITRLGDKQKDFESSNIKYNFDDNMYKYKIICKNCNQQYFRKRIAKNFTKKYVCGKCRGKLKIELINN